MPSNFGTYIHRGTCSLSKFLLVFLLHGWKMKGTASMFGSLRLQQMRWSCGNIIPGFSRAASLPAACPGQQKHTEGSQKFAAATRIRCRGNPFKLTALARHTCWRLTFSRGLGTPHANTKLWWIDTLANNSWQEAAFLKMHGGHKPFCAKLTHRLELVGPEKHKPFWHWLSTHLQTFNLWAGPVASRELYRRLLLPPSLCLRI